MLGKEHRHIAWFCHADNFVSAYDAHFQAIRHWLDVMFHFGRSAYKEDV